MENESTTGTKAPPDELFCAHDWTQAAGELDELRDSSLDSAVVYANESAANFASHGSNDGEVLTADDLLDLRVWLRAFRPG